MVKIRFKRFVLAVVAAAALTALPPSIPAQESGRAAQTGTIQGVVTESTTGEPLAGVRVTLSGSRLDPQALNAFLQFMNARGVTAAAPIGPADEKFLQSVLDAAAARGISPLLPEVRSALNALRTVSDRALDNLGAVTDAAGRFSIANVPFGRYTVRGQLDGYFGGSATGADPGRASAVVTVLGGPAVRADLRLIPAGVIGGHVRDESGRLLTDISVEAFAVNYQNGFVLLRSTVSKSTEDRGEFRLYWLPPGEYFIAATYRPKETAAASAAPPSRIFFPGSADIAAAVPIAVKGGERVEGMDIVLRPAVPAKISGRIISTVPLRRPVQAGQAVQSGQARLHLFGRDPGAPEVVNAAPLPTGSARIDASGGTLEIANVLPGAYDLYGTIQTQNLDGSPGTAVGYASIDIRGQDVSGVTINVAPTVPVTGMVTVDGGAPKHDIKVSIQPDASNAKFQGYQIIAGRPVVASTEDGSFAIPWIPVGHFRLAIEGLLPQEYILDVAQSASVFDSGFEIGSEPPEPLRVLLRTGAGTVKGVVHDAAGQPASATVVLIPAENRRRNRALYHVAIADENGQFTTGGVAPGTYRAFAWTSVTGGAYYNGAFVSRYEDLGFPVTVAEGSTVSLELNAIPDAR